MEMVDNRINNTDHALKVYSSFNHLKSKRKRTFSVTCNFYIVWLDYLGYKTHTYYLSLPLTMHTIIWLYSIRQRQMRKIAFGLKRKKRCGLFLILIDVKDYLYFIESFMYFSDIGNRGEMCLTWKFNGLDLLFLIREISFSNVFFFYWTCLFY